MHIPKLLARKSCAQQSLTISAKPDGGEAACQPWILAGERRSAGLFLVLVVVGLDALDDDVVGTLFADRPLATVGVIA